MKIKAIWQKANSLKGCLFHRKTTTGRRRLAKDEDPLSLDNLFVSDEAKLLSSKAWRMLSLKTQVFTRPRSPLIRSRQSHVSEVVACSVVASEMLGLNSNLLRAAAIGHDIGHVPCGHQGEEWMAKKMGLPEFCHEIMGPIIAQKIERKGKGLNLCFETLEAMMCHSGTKAKPQMSQEAWTLRFADKFTYIFHDINDIVGRMRYPVNKELQEIANVFGKNQRERVSTAIAGLVIESAELGKVSFEQSKLGTQFRRLRALMYEVYVCVTEQKVGSILQPVLEYLEMIKVGDPFLLLALMTDHDVIELSQKPMKNITDFNQTSISEMIPFLSNCKIDLCDPILNW